MTVKKNLSPNEKHKKINFETQENLCSFLKKYSHKGFKI